MMLDHRRETRQHQNWTKLEHREGRRHTRRPGDSILGQVPAACLRRPCKTAVSCRHDVARVDSGHVIYRRGFDLEHTCYRKLFIGPKMVAGFVTLQRYSLVAMRLLVVVKGWKKSSGNVGQSSLIQQHKYFSPSSFHHTSRAKTEMGFQWRCR